MNNKKLIIQCLCGLCLLLTASLQAQSSIEGKWQDPDKGNTILIYEEDGLFYGQLIAAANAEENAKIQEHGDKIVLFRQFEKKSETEFCCGTIYQPKAKKKLKGELKLLSQNELKVTGKLGLIKGSKVWKRVE